MSLPNRDWMTLAKQGHPSCPEGFVYVGKGLDTSMDYLGFGDNLRWDHGSSTGLFGSDSSQNYFCPIKIWEEKTGLKFSGDSGESPGKTLKEIKAELAEAEKLIGKKIIRGLSFKTKVKSVKLFITEPPSFEGEYGSISVNDFFKENEYVIALKCDSSYAFPYQNIKLVGSGIFIGGYEAEDRIDSWCINYIIFSKETLKKAYSLLNSDYFVSSVKISGLNFSIVDLKKLVG